MYTHPSPLQASSSRLRIRVHCAHNVSHIVRTCTRMRSLLELACNGEGGFSIGFSSFTHLTNTQHCQHQPIILTQRYDDSSTSSCRRCFNLNTHRQPAKYRLHPIYVVIRDRSYSVVCPYFDFKKLPLACNFLTIQNLITVTFSAYFLSCNTGADNEIKTFASKLNSNCISGPLCDSSSLSGTRKVRSYQ